MLPTHIEHSAQPFSNLVLSSYMTLYHPTIHSKPFIPAEPPCSASWLSLPQYTPRPPPQVCDEECKLTIDLTHTEVNLLPGKKKQDQEPTFYIRHSKAK